MMCAPSHDVWKSKALVAVDLRLCHPVSNLWSPFNCTLPVFDPHMALRPLTQWMTSSDFSPDEYVTVRWNVTHTVLYNCLFSRIPRTSETPAHFSCTDKQISIWATQWLPSIRTFWIFLCWKKSLSYLAGMYISLSLKSWRCHLLFGTLTISPPINLYSLFDFIFSYTFCLNFYSLSTQNLLIPPCM